MIIVKRGGLMLDIEKKATKVFHDEDIAGIQEFIDKEPFADYEFTRL